MGNSATVMCERRREPVVQRPSDNWVDKCRRAPTQKEWESYMRHYSRRMARAKKCMQCFIEFKNVPSLMTHLGTHHRPTVSYSTISATSDSSGPMCFKCRGSFPSVKALKAHHLKPCTDYWKANTEIVPKSPRMKPARQKPPKLKQPSSEMTKKPRIAQVMLTPKTKRKIDSDNFIIPSQLPVSKHNSHSSPKVKTINSTSCIRQYSRPFSNTGMQTSKRKISEATSSKDYIEGTVYKKGRSSEPKRMVPQYHRVVHSRSSGYVDMTKLRTTERTKNMNLKLLNSVSDLLMVRAVDATQPKQLVVELPFKPPVVPMKPLVVVSKPATNGVGSNDNKSFMVLKVVPIQSQGVVKLIPQPILPKPMQTPGLVKILPKPRPKIIIQTAKPLLVIPNFTNTNNVTERQVDSKADVNGVTNSLIKPNKTYQNSAKKLKSSDSREGDDPFDEIL